MVAETEISTRRPRLTRAEVTLTFRDTGEGPPFDVRLARLLKVALRTFGLRCIDVTTQPPAAPGRNDHHDRT
jgi:hypothetical protein